MPNPVMHFEVMASKNVDAVRKFYADARKLEQFARTKVAQRMAV